MAICLYCNKKTGFFSKFHKDCQLQYNTGVELVFEVANKNFAGKSAFTNR